jgi:hypothetical protein
VASLETSQALQADIPEAVEVRRKVRLLKGVLLWQLDAQFKERLWKLQRSLRQTGEALVTAQRSRRRVDQSMRDEPETFASFGGRLARLSPRIESLKVRVDDAMSRQRTYLQSIAVGEMQAQKERLNTYTVQARFALAAIYDLSSTVGATSP